MRRSTIFSLMLAAIVLACSDDPPPTSAARGTPPAIVTDQAGNARERLALRLAKALSDPELRRDLAARFDDSRAPEGKLQFQALARTENNRLLGHLAAAREGTIATVLADMDEARRLEIYLPVEAHRDIWHGGADFLVATLERDGEAPVAFDAAGNRRLLDPDQPPAIPVIALVPQEFDFTGGRPHLAATCWDYCGGTTPAKPDGGSSGSAGSSGPRGLYMTASTIQGDYEGWLKGKPEYEYHVYGVNSRGESIQLSCAGEHSGGPYSFDQNDSQWSGSVALLTEQDINAYKAQSPQGIVRIVVWEDDDEPCVPRARENSLAELLRKIDTVYRMLTSGKIAKDVNGGLESAKSTFDLFHAVRSWILTGDDIVGTAVAASVGGFVPGGSNWTIKTDGARTTGWFTTTYR